MCPVDIRQMKYFIQVVRCGYNLSRASGQLFLSQPALSKAISEVEQSLGSRLFHRNKGRLVALTPIGGLVYNNALEVVDLYDRKVAEIQRAATEGAQKLKRYPTGHWPPRSPAL